MSGSATTSSMPERLELAGYEPPQVERVLSPEDLEREVLYAGDAASADGSV